MWTSHSISLNKDSRTSTRADYIKRKERRREETCDTIEFLHLPETPAMRETQFRKMISGKILVSRNETNRKHAEPWYERFDILHHALRLKSSQPWCGKLLNCNIWVWEDGNLLPITWKCQFTSFQNGFCFGFKSGNFWDSNSNHCWF